MRIIWGSVAGGFVVFIWGAVSWMMLPFHHATLKTFTNEPAVASIIGINATTPGVYLLPAPHHDVTEQHKPTKPFVFAVVRPEGMTPGDPVYYLRGLLTEIAGAFVLGLVLLAAPGLDYWRRVRLVVLTALAAAALVRLPDWTWWGFSTAFTVLGAVDLLVGWFLGGLVIAKFVRK